MRSVSRLVTSSIIELISATCAATSSARWLSSRSGANRTSNNRTSAFATSVCASTADST